MAGELDRLLIKIVGDASSYLGALKSAADETRKTADSINRSSGLISGFFKNMANDIRGAASAMAALGAGAWLKKNLDFFGQMESQQLRLNAAIEANGQSARKVMADYDAFADSMARQTTVFKANIYDMLRFAETQGVTGANAMRAVQNAISLMATRSDFGQQRAIRATTALEQGRTGPIARVITGLGSIKNESDRVAHAQKRLGEDWQQALAHASSFSGQMTKLGNDLWWLTNQYGDVIAEGVKPFIDAMRDLVGLLSNVDENTKKWIATIGVIIASIVSLTGFLTLAVPAAMAFINPWMLVAGVVVVGISLWVQSMGGLGKAFEYVKEQAITLWEYVKPIGKAFGGIFDAWWQVIKATMNRVGEYIKYVWNDVLGMSKVDWESIREIILEVLISVEFSIRNYEKYIAMVWAAILYKTVQTFEVIVYWMKDVPFAAGKWFWNNFLTLAGYSLVAYAEMWETSARKIIKGISGVELQSALEDLRKNIGKSFTDFILPDHIPTALEDRLKKEWEEKKKKFMEGDGESYEEFLRRRLTELSDSGELQNEAKKAGENTAKAYTKGAAKEMKKFDAVLFGSAEHLRRLAEYANKIYGQSKVDDIVGRDPKYDPDIKRPGDINIGPPTPSSLTQPSPVTGGGINSIIAGLPPFFQKFLPGGGGVTTSEPLGSSIPPFFRKFLPQAEESGPLGSSLPPFFQKFLPGGKTTPSAPVFNPWGNINAWLGGVGKPIAAGEMANAAFGMNQLFAPGGDNKSLIEKAKGGSFQAMQEIEDSMKGKVFNQQDYIEYLKKNGLFEVWYKMKFRVDLAKVGGETFTGGELENFDSGSGGLFASGDPLKSSVNPHWSLFADQGQKKAEDQQDREIARMTLSVLQTLVQLMAPERTEKMTIIDFEE